MAHENWYRQASIRLAIGDLAGADGYLRRSAKSDSQRFRGIARARLQLLAAHDRSADSTDFLNELVPPLKGEAVTVEQPSLGLDWIHAMCQYDVGSDGPLSQAIRRMKRNQWKGQQTTKAFAVLMAEWLAQMQVIRMLIDVIVPTPSVPGRRRHDIASILAEQASKEAYIPVQPLVEFVRHPVNLRGLNHAERYQAMAGSFKLTRGADVRDMRVLLIDDLLTHGATFHEIAITLRAAGADFVAALVVGVTKSRCGLCTRRVRPFGPHSR